MAITIDLPPNLKIADRSDPFLAFNTRSGGPSLNGVEQIVSPLSAVWRWRVTIPLRTRADVRSYRTVRTRLQGRFNYLRMSVCDRHRLIRRDVGAWVDGYTGAVHFDSGSGLAPPQPAALVLDDAARGATMLVLRASDLNGALTAGVFFSIEDWLYHVDDFVVVDDTLEIRVSPPLREAVTGEDATASFDARALWTLDTDDTGQVDLAGGRRGVVTLNLTEAFGRAL